MKTEVVKNISRKWYIIDAKNKILGKVCAEAAAILRGKHRVEFTPNMDNGDCVLIINSAKIKVSANKEKGKIYYRHTGHPGGLRQETFESLLKRRPTEPITRGIKGMLPKGRLGRAMIKKLRIYKDNTNPHISQIKE